MTSPVECVQRPQEAEAHARTPIIMQNEYTRPPAIGAPGFMKGPDMEMNGIVLSPDEISLVKALADYPATVIQAAENFSPAVIANYLYELSKQYNGYYHDIPILRESDPTVQAVRLRLSQTVAEVIASGAGLLGINVPERM